MSKPIIFSIISLLLTFCFADINNDIYENSWAVVIGINKYHNAPTLSYAVQDAQSVQSMLIDSFDYPPENISLITDEQATKDNILRTLSSLTNKAESNDRVLIFFAGHGATMDLPNGGEAGYLLPIEGDNNDLYLSSIGMDELQKISSMSKSKHMLFLIDVCYGGIASVTSRSLGPIRGSGNQYIEKIIKNKARQIITAGGRGEQVIEKPEWAHSAFTKNLLSGLQDWNADSDEDGNITEIIPMGDYSSGQNFYYRIPDPLYHTVMITSEIAVFHESTTGPFKRSDTIFAPWSPKEKDLHGVKIFMKRFADL